jgi:hypothetical protein
MYDIRLVAVLNTTIYFTDRHIDRQIDIPAFEKVYCPHLHGLCVLRSTQYQCHSSLSVVPDLGLYL